MLHQGTEATEADADPARISIAPDEPAPVEIVNPDAATGLLFICDHAANRIPLALGDLGLDEAALARHVAWDIGAADLARRLAARFAATLVMTCYSRLVIDCNRALDDPTSIPALSEDVVVPGNHEVGPAEEAARAATFFRPYHDAVAAAIAQRQARGQVPALISIHSFTPIFHGHERPWQIGIMWNRDERLARPLLARLDADPEIDAGENVPYSAHDNFGYSMDTYGEATGLPHVLIETRQDLIDTHHGAEEWAGRLGEALDGAMAATEGLGRG